MRKVVWRISFGAIFIFALTSTAVAQLSFGASGAIEEWAYGDISSKGLNLGGIVGLSDETHFRANFGFLTGTRSLTVKEHYSDSALDTTWTTKYKDNLTVFPLEFWYLAHLPVGKTGSFYPGLGLGFCFGSLKSREEYEDTTIKKPTHSLFGFGIPIVIGIEKAVFGENIRLFAELQKNFYLVAKGSWTYEESDTGWTHDEEGNYTTNLSDARIRLGLAFMFGAPAPKAVPQKALRGRRAPMPKRK